MHRLPPTRYVFSLPLKCKADRVGCYPFQDRDPFVLEETPHIFFAGNQPEYASRLIQGSIFHPPFKLMMKGSKDKEFGL